MSVEELDQNYGYSSHLRGFSTMEKYKNHSIHITT